MWKSNIEIEEKQGEKLTVNNIQMIEGATTIVTSPKNWYVY